MTRVLNVELVPRPLWGRSLANIARKGWGPQWEAIRMRELSRTAGKCDFCPGRGVIVHEHWEYDESRSAQRLAGFSVSCDKCELVHHPGRAGQMGRANEALGHLMSLKRISQPDAERLIERAFDVWKRRSSHPWIQDLSWLRSEISNYGLSEDDIDRAEELLSQSS